MMSGIKSVVYGCRLVPVYLLGLLLLVPACAQTDTSSQAREIIRQSIVSAGGPVWDGINTMTIHESQARNTDNGILQMEIVHTLDTKGRGYRMEITSKLGKQIYGWDGQQFWAVIDGRHGDEAQVKEARRLVSDAFYRFSLPFILDDEGSKLEYAGKDTVNGKATDVVKITYSGGPVDSYWKEGEQHHGDHGGAKHETSADKHAAASGGDHGNHGGGGHHGGSQIYFFHIDEEDRIVKIYFSHHGDDSYETFLFDEFTTINGITREQSRKLIRADGNTHYDSRFSRAEFRTDSNTEVYQSPHH